MSSLRRGFLLLVSCVTVAAASGCATTWTRQMNHGYTALWAGDAPRAVGSFERAVALVDDGDERRSISFFALGYALHRAGRPADAEPPLRQSLSLLEARHGAAHPALVPTLAGLAAVLREDPARRAEFDDVVARIVESDGADPDWAPSEPGERFALGMGFADAGSLLLRADRNRDAEALFERAAPMLLAADPSRRTVSQAALDDYVALLRETGREDEAERLLAPSSSEPDYLRYVTFEGYGGDHFVTRWPTSRMPLRVHLPRPPDGMFTDPEAVLDSVRDGILDWADVAEPGVPSFEFVDDAGDADIPIVWSPVGTTWFIAFASYTTDRMTRRFGVSHVLVTAKYHDGSEAPLDRLYATMLHEMGHALGLAGHSPEPGDVMFPKIGARDPSLGLSARDRATLGALYASPIGRRIVGAKRAD